MRVNILKSLSSDGRRHNLYLNWSKPVPHPVTGKATRRKYLKIELIIDPRNAIDRSANKEMMAVAERKRAEALTCLAMGDYSFLGEGGADGVTLQAYIKERQKDAKECSQGVWRSAIKHLKEFDRSTIALALVDRKFMEGLKAHLLKTCARNSAVVNFVIVRGVLNTAYREELIKMKVCDLVKPIQPEPGKREHLSKEEVTTLENTECENEMVKRAGMFAIYTGLRVSDIEKVTLQDIKNGVLVHKQTKTGSNEHLPISKKAMTYLDKTKKPGELQFAGLGNKLYNKNCYFKRWVRDSGIKKSITMHTMRHTYATLLLTAGVDLYTVSKLLGHKSIKVTQVYGKIVDGLKRSAVELL